MSVSELIRKYQRTHPWLPLITMSSRDHLRSVIAHETPHLETTNLRQSWWSSKASHVGWNTRNYSRFLPLPPLLNQLEKRRRAPAYSAVEHREKLVGRHAARVTDSDTGRSALMRTELLMELSPSDYEDFH